MKTITRSQFDYSVLASYVLPADILKYFDVTQVVKESTGHQDSAGAEIKILHIYLDEKDLRAELWHDLSPNGFTEYRMISDFPIRDLCTRLHVRRRRWLDSEGHNVILNQFSLVQEGTGYSVEFAAFLKESHGYLSRNC